LMVAACGYFIDLAIYWAMPGLAMTVTQYTFIGEVALPLWLLVKGVNVEQWQRRAIAA